MLKTKKKILIASGSSGTGHIHAALNIRESLTLTEKSLEIECIDTFKYISPGIRVTCDSGWEFASINLKLFYRNFHSVIINKNPFSELCKRFIMLQVPRIINSINFQNVKAFIATHPIAAALGAALKQRFNFTLFVAPTDFILHNFYCFPEVDFYFLPPNFEIVNSISNSLDIYGKSITTGIPISPHYWIQQDRDTICEKLGLSSGLFTILICFGGSGLNGNTINSITKRLLEISKPLQILIISGKNPILYNKLCNSFSNYSGIHKIKVYEFINNMAEIMTVTNLFLGKAGGLTLSEALAKGLPIGIVKPLPGQEDYNTNYIKKNNAGILMKTKNDLINFVYKLLETSTFYEWNNHIIKLGRPESSKVIASFILDAI